MFSAAVLVTGAALAGYYSDRSQYGALAEAGVHTTATVTRAEPRDHNAVYYTFEVDGATYAAGGFADPPNPDASQLRAGDTIQIVYEARDPRDSCACDPEVRPPNLLASFLGGLGIGVLPAAFVVLRRPRRQPESLSGT
jgi:hypothetical protein